MYTYPPANSIFDGPITNLLSVPCILIEVLSRVQAKGAETLIGRFSSDGAANMAVKGLTLNEATAVDNYTKLYVSLHLQLPRWYHPSVFFYTNGVYRLGGGFLPSVSGRYPSSHHYVLAVTDEVLR